MKRKRAGPKYKLTEIFYSIQGEGRFTGYPMVFVRFSGCNLACPWCDTDHEARLLLDADQVVARVIRWPQVGRVCLTGGEPLLQVDYELLVKLHAEGLSVHIETNGTLDPPRNCFQWLDWLTVSPKKRWHLRSGDELKVIYQGQDLIEYEQADFRHFYLQPLWTSDELEREKYQQMALNAVMENPRWILSSQVHKLLGCR